MNADQSPNHLLPIDLRDSMRYWTAGVAVVSTVFEGQHHGMTVSSFTSVSLDPPLVLVSIEQKTRTHEIIGKSNIFGISILSSQQEEISNRFAGRENDLEDRFAGIDTFSLGSGVLFIQGGLAFFECAVKQGIAAGSHTVFIAQVVASQSGPENGSPLVYFNRNYRGLNL